MSLRGMVLGCFLFVWCCYVKRSMYREVTKFSHFRVGIWRSRTTEEMRVSLFYRRARACPSPCYRARARSRGTGPRATVGEAAPSRRARACPSPCPSGARTLAGDRPPRYGEKNVPFHRRARACPSPCHRSEGKRPGSAFGFRAGRALAGDRPPRYGKKTPPLHVGRGPVPRHRSGTRAFAGARAPFPEGLSVLP